MWKHKAKLRYVDIYVFIHTIYTFFFMEYYVNIILILYKIYITPKVVCSTIQEYKIELK